ncbi:conserved hypothetical protein [Marinobacter salarius]|uniref:DUF2570 family protein n=1 Tax=Marinobacter salarius TaxID=1420917 RepID=UPI001255B370|nr:DUF2570 family protein [Marinobacter salarius]VVT02892.1 conserved hypothetical protein [Marinobacter salarius]VXC24640.1 conserved hypothetical protein [Marinobacter salarius]
MTKIVAGGIAVLILLLAISGYVIKGLYEDVGQLEQANSQLEQSLSDQVAENAEMANEMQRRDQAVLNAKRAKDKAESEADAIRRERDKALKDDPWIHDDVPAAVIDSLQAGARPDQD